MAPFAKLTAFGACRLAQNLEALFFLAIIVDFVLKYEEGQGQFGVFTIYFGTVFCVEDTACGYPNG